MSGVPYVFGNATTSIPLSQLDVNFATNATIGTTSVGLGNTTTTLVGLTNVSTTVVNTSNVSANTSLLLQTNGTTTAVTIDTNQNVGIGVTPSAWYSTLKGFDIGSYGAVFNNSTSGAGLTGNAYINTSASWTYKNTAAATYYQQTAGTHAWYNAPSGTAGNAITFTQAMTLDTSGNLLMGLTSTSTTAGGTVIFTGANSGIAIGHATGSGAIYNYFQYNGTTIGSVSQNGTTGVLYNVTSDQRLKENIQDADSASNLIDSLQVRKFNWKSDNSHQRYGFIAQELVTVAPEAVHQPVDPEEMMAVDYSKLVPMLVKEIQSLRKRLADAGIA